MECQDLELDAGPAETRPRGRVIRMLMADGQIYEHSDIIVNNTVRAPPQRQNIVEEDEYENETQAEDEKLLP